MDLFDPTEQSLGIDYDEASKLIGDLEMALGIKQDGQSSPGHDSVASDSSFDGDGSSPIQAPGLSINGFGEEFLASDFLDAIMNEENGNEDFGTDPDNQTDDGKTLSIKAEPGNGLMDIMEQASVAADIPVPDPHLDTDQSAGESPSHEFVGKMKGVSSTTRQSKPGRKRKLKLVEVAPPSVVQQLELELANEPDKAKKNAIIAKLNREKKKIHIHELEEQNMNLSDENGHLKSQLEETQKSHGLLEEEVLYLKNVLANQSRLSKLLKDINPSSLQLTSSFNLDHDYDGSSIKRSRSDVTPTGGICLHVHNEHVSMEFCAKCAQMANGARRVDIEGV